ncbi:unnamed protein product [Linum trigynum]|uniref:Uncharacterized protein n=1 Tax=Linum trigynum TaxID=586398 RepID=A0AAV2D7W4_9ROSI
MICKACKQFGHDCSRPVGRRTKQIWRIKEKRSVVVESVETLVDKGKGILIDQTQVITEEIGCSNAGELFSPPITHCALPSTEVFNAAVNGSRPKIVQVSPPPILQNSFAAIYAKPPVLINPVPLRAGREGLRSGKGAAKAAYPSK